MKIVKNHLFVLAFFLVSCGGSSNGEIAITLDLSLSSAEQDSIEHFVFIVSDPNANDNTSTLYPSDCISSSGGSACIKAEACGFSRDLETFDPSIDFDEFAKDSTIAITACGLTNTSGYVGAGSAQVTNADGQSASITINNTTACTGLPNPCP